MTYKTMPITLVSTTSRSMYRSLHHILTGLGYKDVDTLKCHKVSATDSGQNRIFIVPLDADHKSDLPVTILDAVKKFYHQPVLGVLPAATKQWNKEILKYCNEFVRWPCDSREIDLRIERLGYLLLSDSKMEPKGRIYEEFINLKMVGGSSQFIHVLQQIKKIACCDAPVLIEGESGTGKELTARAIHYLGERRDHPFIPINCGAIPDSLLENELFGHRQGAYTDAKTNQDGIVRQSEGGTLFLDEVETFSPKGQVVLLRFLQDLQYKVLGGNMHKQANVRIIAASNVKLKELVKQGRFRKDLYYRLDIMPILMPPLSQRGNDVLELADYFLNKYRIRYNQPEKRLGRDARKSLTQYHWPGNIRELENMLHRAFLMADGSVVMLNEISSRQHERRKRIIDRRQERYLNKNMLEAKAEIVRRFEIEYLTRLLDETKGNVTKAAKKAGKERRSLGKLIKKHGIDKTLHDRS